MSDWYWDCSSTTGWSTLLGASALVVSAGGRFEGSAGLNRAASYPNSTAGVVVAGDLELQMLANTHNTSSGVIHLVAINLDTSDLNPFVGYGIQATHTQIIVNRVVNASTFTAIGTYSRTSASTADMVVRAEFDDQGSNYNIRTYEDGVLRGTITAEGTNDLASTTHFVVVQAQGSGTSVEQDDLYVRQTLTSERVPPPLVLPSQAVQRAANW